MLLSNGEIGRGPLWHSAAGRYGPEGGDATGKDGGAEIMRGVLECEYDGGGDEKDDEEEDDDDEDDDDEDEEDDDEDEDEDEEDNAEDERIAFALILAKASSASSDEFVGEDVTALFFGDK